MANTSPDAITFPDTVDRVGQIQPHLATMAASVQAAITDVRNDTDADFADIFALPAGAISTGASVQAISATAWAAIPNITSISMNFTRPAWVMATFGAWMVASTGDLRGGIALSGATVQAPNVPGWGQTLYLGGVAGTVQNTCQKLVLVGAGTTTFQAQAYQSGGGTKQMNYTTLQVVPIRWASPPA